MGKLVRFAATTRASTVAPKSNTPLGEILGVFFFAQKRASYHMTREARIIEHMPLRTDNLIIPQGTTWEIRWPIVDANGDPADLTGWAVRACVRTTKASAIALHEWSTSAGNAPITESGVSLLVSPAESSEWKWQKGFYDVEIFHSDGRVLRVTQGTMTVDLEVTR